MEVARIYAARLGLLLFRLNWQIDDAPFAVQSCIHLTETKHPVGGTKVRMFNGAVQCGRAA